MLVWFVIAGVDSSWTGSCARGSTDRARTDTSEWPPVRSDALGQLWICSRTRVDSCVKRKPPVFLVSSVHASSPVPSILVELATMAESQNEIGPRVFTGPTD